MSLSETMWDIFKETGHINAYLIFKDYQRLESANDNPWTLETGVEE